MKKLSLKSKVLLGAILMGGTMAGAHAVVNTPDPQEQRYDWNGDGPDHTGPLPNATLEEALEAYGCEEVAPEPCAIGTAENAPDEHIYKF